MCFLPSSKPDHYWLSSCLGTMLMVMMLASCQRTEVEDQLVAEVFDKRLYASELRAMIPPESTADDSLLLWNAYVDRWIRESIMMHEAESNAPEDLEIDKLVQDYRASLLRHQYEKNVVETLLDTLINDAELQEYYQDNKSQYLLESTIVRCHFMKVPSNVSGDVVRKFDELWRKDRSDDEFTQLVDLCNRYATTFYLSDSIWYKLDLISQEMPEGAVNESVIRSNEVFQLENNDYYCFLKILEIKDRKEIAPLTYIQEQASKVILHKRKIALLEKWKEDLYERAYAQDNIKIY